MKKIALALCGVCVTVICSAQTEEIKTYSSSIPKLVYTYGVNVDDMKYPQNKETYTYYLDSLGNKVRHGKYTIEGSNDDMHFKCSITANYTKGILNGLVQFNSSRKNNFSVSASMNFKNGVPDGVWTYSHQDNYKEYRNRYDFIEKISITISNGEVTKFNCVRNRWVYPDYEDSRLIKENANGSFVNGKMEGVWNTFTDSQDNSYTLHNGIVINSPEVKSYAYGQITQEQLENKGWFEVCQGVGWRFDGIETLNHCIYQFGDKNLNLLETFRFPGYNGPRMFEQKKVMDDGMFESLLDETGAKESNDPELADNPYGFKKYRDKIYEFDSVYNTYCAFSKIGDFYLTTKQKEVFAPLIKSLEEKEEAERLEQQKKIEAERLEQQKKIEAERLARERESIIGSINSALANIKKLQTEADRTYYFSLNHQGVFYSTDGSSIKQYIESYLPLKEYQIESLSENLDEATLILTTIEQPKGLFKAVFGKEKRLKYKVVVRIKEQRMCIEDFDVSKATLLSE